MRGSLKNYDSSAQKFVDRLLTEGSAVGLDETTENSIKNDELPPFYNEKLFKKGQNVFNNHIFAFFMGKLLGLLSILSVPTILRILIFTRMSGSVLTAYKRYLATIFHMMVWYQTDFKPGSKSWKSISQVRYIHNSASKKSYAANINIISQKDMALTQFGFMGFALTRSEKIGIHGVSEDELEAFLHVWRVIGYLMGIEDRFNLCGGSVKETREICNILIDRVFRTGIEKKDKDFLSMSRYLIEGLWTVNPILEFRTVMTFLHTLIVNVENCSHPSGYIQLNFGRKCLFYLLRYTGDWLKCDIFRLFENNVLRLSLWLMKVFPFLAYYMFGRANSHVSLKL